MSYARQQQQARMRQQVMQGDPRKNALMQQFAGGGMQDEILGRAGLTADQLTPELQAQLNQLLGHAERGERRRYEDMLQGFTSTAPIAVAQSARLDPYAQAGGEALEQQMALLGLRGQDAMQAAYMENPAHQFQQQQMERALLRNRAATGGLGDEGVMRALTEMNVGLTNQGIQQQLGQLGALSGMGGQMSMAQGQFAGGQMADSLGIQTALRQQRSMRNAQRGGLAGRLGMAGRALSFGANFIPGLQGLSGLGLMGGIGQQMQDAGGIWG